MRFRDPRELLTAFWSYSIPFYPPAASKAHGRGASSLRAKNEDPARASNNSKTDQKTSVIAREPDWPNMICTIFSKTTVAPELKLGCLCLTRFGSILRDLDLPETTSGTPEEPKTPKMTQ